MHHIQTIFSRLRRTPIHPQWLVFRGEEERNRDLKKLARGIVLDVGCADQYIRSYLEKSVRYVGLDYFFTASEWYRTTPTVFGDAQKLPFPDNSIDTILLLDVLEHLPDSEVAVSEMVRVLRIDGCLILQVPFLYPLHDVPLDFQRWTHFGLRKMMSEHGLAIVEEYAQGATVETCGLLMNIGLCKLLLLWINQKKIASILGVIILPLVPVINLLCYLLAKISPEDVFMPSGYRFILTKKR